MGSFVQLCLLPELWSLKCQKWLILCTFCWMQQNISSSLDKLFKCICRVLFGPFRKYNGLCTSELPLAKFQCFKTQDFGIHICSLRNFSAVYPQYLTNSSVQSLLTKPFSANLSSLRAFNIFPKTVTNFLLLSAENTK